MGRRSRKRGGVATAAPAPSRPPTERPHAPWHPFPLVELSVLIGLVLLVWGFVRHDDPGGRVLLVSGMVLASLGGLDTALREHFGGYKSHSLLLAALPGVLTAGVLFFARAPWLVVPLAGAAVGVAAFVALQRAFRSHS